MKFLQGLKQFGSILTNLDDQIVREEGLETQLQYNLAKKLI